MKSSTTHQLDSTPGIFQPVFSGSAYAQPAAVHFALPPAGGARVVKAGRYMSAGSLLRGGEDHQLASHHSAAAAEFSRPSDGPSLKKRRAARSARQEGDSAADLAFGRSASKAFEANFSLFNPSSGAVPPDAAAASAVVHHQDTWNIFSASTGVTVESEPTQSPAIGAVDLDFASELATDGLADSLLNTAAAVAEQQRAVAPFSPLLGGDLVVDPGGGGHVWPEASLMAAGPVVAGAQQTDTSSTASSSPGAALSRSQRDEQVNRPELSEAMIEELNDILEFKKDERYLKHIIPYRDKISFPIGEGGRELLRACLNVRGCKGRQLQGASVPILLQLAHQWQLWDVALRIKIERQTGQLSPAHDAFVKFKATQSQMRKFVRKEYMVTERDQLGKIARIHYDENRKIKLGKDGRESLRAKLRRLHEKHASRMDELLAQHGFKYSELRNATVQQLGRMAFVCNLWDQVISACRSQEEKRDGKGNRILRNGAESQIKLPLSLINEPIVTDENGQMSNDDARRTMDAVSQLLQQNYGQSEDGNPDIFSSSTFAQAFSFAAYDTSPLPTVAGGGSSSATDLVDVKKEPRDEDDEEELHHYGGEELAAPQIDRLMEAYTSSYHHSAAGQISDTHDPQDQADTHHTSGTNLTKSMKSLDASDLYNNFDPSTGGFF